MSWLTDLLGGGGGGGGGDSGYYDWYRNFVEDQIAKEKLTEERTTEQAKTQADVRRNEVADRTGYSGLVTVGPGVQDSDATLAAQMALLDPTDPQRQTYDAQIAAEAQKRDQATRIITGEQYAAEDAFKELGDQITAATDSATLDALQKQFEDLTAQYDWYGDTVKYDDWIKKQRNKIAEAAKSPTTTPTTSEGGG